MSGNLMAGESSVSSKNTTLVLFGVSPLRSTINMNLGPTKLLPEDQMLDETCVATISTLFDVDVIDNGIWCDYFWSYLKIHPV